MSQVKIRIKKLKEADNPEHPDNIQEGFEKTVYTEEAFVSEPEVGLPFWLGTVWRTSPVVKILSENTFETYNSIYEWKVIKA